MKLKLILLKSFPSPERDSREYEPFMDMKDDLCGDCGEKMMDHALILGYGTEFKIHPKDIDKELLITYKEWEKIKDASE